jgi:hypothetical protein
MGLSTIGPQHLGRAHAQFSCRSWCKGLETRINKAHTSDAENMADRQIEGKMTCLIRKKDCMDIASILLNYVTAPHIATELVQILLLNQAFQSSNLCSEIGNAVLAFLSPCSSPQLWKSIGTAAVSFHALALHNSFNIARWFLTASLNKSQIIK